MLRAILRISLDHRELVMIAAIAVLVIGGVVVRRMPVDVFPDLDRPTVTIMSESPGLAPEEVETLVTRPIELVLNGATGVKRVRSSSTIGFSIVWVEFDWGTNIFVARQIVDEKLQLARSRLPSNSSSVLAPVSSIMGEIALIGLRSDRQAHSPEERLAIAMELRTLGEFELRNRLMAIEGVSQVTAIGGVLKQYQILTSPARLASQQITLEQLTEAASRANAIAGGGILNRGDRESLIRIQGQSLSLDEIASTPIIWREPVPVTIGDVADVRWGGPVRRGDASVSVKEVQSLETSGESTTDGSTSDESGRSPWRGGPSVILTVQKQPAANTLVLDREIDRVLQAMQDELPEGVRIESQIFRQSHFIETAVDHVLEAVRDGAIWVVVVLFLLMGNIRSSLSSLISMPLSILLAITVFYFLGISINTMTLGGIAIAIGDLVDDSIVDIENIYRRLRENRQKPAELRQKTMHVIYAASCEVRGSIVYATLIVMLVVCPLFFLPGIEGRLFAPMGMAYITSLLCSLLIALTLTPALASYLLPGDRFLERASEPRLMRWIKAIDARILKWVLRHSHWVLGVVSILVLISCMTLAWMGGEFLPPLQEGTATVNLRLEPGTSLTESQRIAGRVEQLLLEIPEVISIARRTGRAELDEHAEGVNNSEMEVKIAEHKVTRPGWTYALLRAIPGLHLWSYEYHGRPREEVFADIRQRVSSLPGAAVNVGQPISHRLDHMISGIRAQVAIKVFGQDLGELRAAAFDIQSAMHSIPGVVDLQIEPQVEISQVRLQVKHEEASRYGLSPGEVANLLEIAYQGRVVSQILEGDQYFSLVVWYDEASRSDPHVIQETILETPSGRRVSLGQVAEVIDTTGPNQLNRENVQRRIAVSCNTEGRDLASVVADIRQSILPIEQRLQALPGSYRLEFSGQMEAQQAANRQLWLLGSLSVAGILLLLHKALRSWRAAIQVLANIPLAAMGAIIALLITNRPSFEMLQSSPWYAWPSVWISATHLSLAHWVGFITLIGIVSRNGILMISHYLYLMEEEGEPFGEPMIIRGSLERLSPVLMTAMTSFMGLLPLLFGYGEAGKEILQPLAVVVFGGMLASTLLDQWVTPALFYRFGRIHRRDHD